MTKEVLVVPYNVEWPKMYQMEINRIFPVLKSEIIAMHHIGSTSIPGIWAKPVIDILLEVKTITNIDEYNESMINLGYEPRGEFRILGRRYFSKKKPPDMRAHIHAYQSGNLSIERHLAFRNYMIAHPEAAQKYANLKRELAQKYPMDIDSYCEGKKDFVDGMESKAILWYRKQVK
ncbi:MAG: GrpB family protein [Candidatus Thorarchaeota archaeon]|nr:GrpB family protein [Candidatus Thorarchaeota archaeon]